MEAICFQTNDILKAIYEDCGSDLVMLKVDGGMATSNVFAQILSDISGVDIGKP